MNRHHLRRPRTLTGLVAAAVVALALAPMSTASAQQHRPPQPTGPGRPATQAALEDLVASGTPGAIAGVDSGRGRSWYGTAGVADLERPRPRTRADHFRIGSITKTFTAVTLLKLEAEGSLSLDDSVEKWLPGVFVHSDYDGRSITLRQLLNHTSGVFDILKDQDFVSRYTGAAFLEHRYDSWTPDQLVKIATSHPPVFEPGDEWRYSNTDYLLAGMVIEAATGQSYADVVESRLLRPLRLDETVVPGLSPTLPEPHARAYSRLFVDSPEAKVYDVTEFNPSMAGAAGEIISTTHDLNRFFGALLGGRVLPARQQDELLTGVDTGRGYAYGLGVRSYPLTCGVTVWGHDGDILGSVTYAVSTEDGSHVLSLNTNDNWNDDEPARNVIKADFCHSSARQGRP
ncbi:serine hydrolase domain-containing protein [Streptomyces sp. NPDC059679]|uniref:serine hydrolase domain-containing protein n=1 Tax=Streptomyces sp. NPDC059679 TaxID=3346903 RepID=UPI0036A5A80C